MVARHGGGKLLTSRQPGSTEKGERVREERAGDQIQSLRSGPQDLPERNQNVFAVVLGISQTNQTDEQHQLLQRYGAFLVPMLQWRRDRYLDSPMGLC